MANIWKKAKEKPFQFWREIWIWVVVILLQLYLSFFYIPWQTMMPMARKATKFLIFFSKLFFKRLDLSIARPDSKWRKFENMIPDSTMYISKYLHSDIVSFSLDYHSSLFQIETSALSKLSCEYLLLILSSGWV